MKMTVIGTGSSGNMYVLDHDGQRLILDAGMPVRMLIRALGGTVGIEGCLVTHEHQDHVRSAMDLMGYGIDVYATGGTIKAARLEGNRLHLVNCELPFSTVNYMILPFRTEHDAEEPCGFLVRHLPTGITILYATDTYYLRNTFPYVNFWLVECNYCDDLVEKQVEDGRIDHALLNRLRKSHMSLRRLLQTLDANDLSQTRKIVLLHLSDQRSDELRMMREVEQATGVETVAADMGMVIDLDLIPF